MMTWNSRSSDIKDVTPTQTHTQQSTDSLVRCQVCIARKKTTTDAYIMCTHTEEKCFNVFYTLKLYDQAERSAGST